MRSTTCDWDAYWRNATSGPAQMDGGPRDPALERFWSELFARALPALSATPSLLDLGCGNGAVVGFALASARRSGGDTELRISALDGSPAALAELRKRHPEADCVAADAALLPFPDDAFDLVTSQFGLEYAGAGAAAEAARMVSPVGVFAALLHFKDGPIFRECAVNFEAIDDFRSCELLRRFEEAYRAALDAREGRGSKAAFQEADRRLAESVRGAEAILRRRGREIATGMLFRVYSDIGHMYRRLAAYEPREVFEWISVIARELDSYAGRMASMLDVALDDRGVERAMGELRARGLEIRRHDTLKFDRATAPCAWVIVAARSR